MSWPGLYPHRRLFHATASRQGIPAIIPRDRSIDPPFPPHTLVVMRMTEATKAFEEARLRAEDLSTWRLHWWIRSLRRRIQRHQQELDMARLSSVEAVCRDRTGTVPRRRGRQRRFVL